MVDALAWHRWDTCLVHVDTLIDGICLWMIVIG
jgi:hypothetical protein